MEQFFGFLPYVGWVLIAITILVFVHEMGHFLTAKLFKMRVDKFSVGFPPKIIGKTVGDTEYVIGATPLGGYVKIAGMVDESMDTDSLHSEPEPWEFRSKPVWQRIIVITAGVIFNVILAAIIFICLKLAYGDQYIPAENVNGIYVADSSLAYNIGIRTGDRIIAVSGKELERYDDLTGKALLGDPLTFTVLREGRELTLNGPDDIMTQLGRAGDEGLGINLLPSVIAQVEGEAALSIGLQSYDKITAINGNRVGFWSEIAPLMQETQGEPIAIEWERSLDMADTTMALPENVERIAVTSSTVTYNATVTPMLSEDTGMYVLGVYRPNEGMMEGLLGIRKDELSVSRAIVLGINETWSNTGAIVTSLSRIVTGREDFRENLGGPVMVAKVTKEAADAGVRYFWRIVAMLSITLAIMNILPIPALDGGHLVFLLYEGITRREPSLKVRMALQQIGMVLLLVLMTFLVFNDVLRWG